MTNDCFSVQMVIFSWNPLRFLTLALVGAVRINTVYKPKRRQENILPFLICVLLLLYFGFVKKKNERRKRIIERETKNCECETSKVHGKSHTSSNDDDQFVSYFHTQYSYDVFSISAAAVRVCCCFLWLMNARRLRFLVENDIVWSKRVQKQMSVRVGPFNWNEEENTKKVEKTAFVHDRENWNYY